MSVQGVRIDMMKSETYNVFSNDIENKKLNVKNINFVLKILEKALIGFCGKIEKPDLEEKCKKIDPPVNEDRNDQKRNYVDLTGDSSDDDSLEQSNLHLIRLYVERMRCIHGLHVVSIEKVDNKVTLGMQNEFAKLHNLEKQEKVILFHGTKRELKPSIILKGFLGVLSVRTALGPGTYFSDQFRVALEYAAEDSECMMTVFVAECHLGNIKKIVEDRRTYNFEGSDELDWIHTRVQENAHYFMLSADSQSNNVAVITMKKVRAMGGSPAIVSAVAPPPNMNVVRRTKAQDVDDQAKHEINVKKQKMIAQKAVENAIWMKDITEHQKPVENKHLNIAEFDGLAIGDIVYLSKVHPIINLKKGVVRSMLRDKGILKIIVEMCTQDIDKDIIRINECMEVKNHKTGHSRYGNCMKSHYVVCQWNQVNNREKDKTKIKIVNIAYR